MGFLKDKPIAIQVGAFTDHRNAKNLTVKNYLIIKHTLKELLSIINIYIE